MRLRNLIASGLAATLCSGLVAMTPGIAEAAARTGPGTLTVALTTAPSTLDPQGSDLAADRQAWALSYQCLMNTTPTGQVVPELATGYSVGDNGLTYTFTLRRGVKFQDGSTLTSADVAATFHRLFTSGNPSLRSLFPTYKSLTALGTYKVEFKLSSPDAGFVDAMASPLAYGCSILSEKGIKSGKLATQMDGTGPWQEVAYSPQSSLTLKRFPDYWGPKTKSAELRVLYVPESTTQVTDLESGTVALILPPQSAAKALTSRSGITVKAVPSDVTVFLDINSNTAPFNNIFVRRALAVAVDRSSLAQIAYVGAAVPSAYVPPSYSWGAKLKDLPYSQYNPSEAKALLVKAGYKSGLPITVKYIVNYDPGTNSLMAQLASELDAVGFRVTLDPLQVAAWLEQTNTNADYTLSWNEQTYYSDPYSYVAVPAYRYGPGKGSIPVALQKLTNAMLNAKTGAEYQARIVAVEKWEAENVYPTITLLALKQYVAYRGRLTGVNVPASGSMQFLANVGS